MNLLTVGGKQMPSLATALRERFHPVHQLRRVSLIRRGLALVDVPVWARVRGVHWPVRVRLVRDASHLLLSHSPEPHITALVEAAVEAFRPRDFWDVGAYFGYYGFLVKSHDARARVTFCEPDPANAELVRRTLDRTGSSGMCLLEAALSDVDGTAVFASDPISGSTAALDPRESVAHRIWDAARNIDVTTLTLDTAVAGDRVDMLKIDVEGHEEQVVRGGARTLERFRPLIVFECFHGGDEICERLEQLGYEIFDAERLGARTPETTNFFGLPPQHRDRREDLLTGWRARLERR